MQKKNFLSNLFAGKKLLHTLAIGLTVCGLVSLCINTASNAQNRSIAGGVLPVYRDYDTPVVEASKSSLRQAIESKYIPEGLLTNYPKVRNQSPYGTCWAHATTGIAEFSAYTRFNAPNNKYDLSELHLAYYCNRTYTKEHYGNTLGDNTYLSNSMMDSGGNTGVALMSLLNWKGYADESDYPYPSSGMKLSDLQIFDSRFNAENAYDSILRVKNVYEVDVLKDSSHAKELIKQYGGISINYYEDFDDHNDTYDTYYSGYASVVNHAVVAVGWDDNFSKEKFGVKKPSGNGAWLIRNSWGDNDYGENGYFWLSYYEPSINYVDGVNYEPSFAVEVITPGDKEYYDNNYSYDGGLANLAFTSSTGAKAANVFKCEKVESLKAVGAYLLGANTEYTVSVYKLKKGFKNPEDGTCLDTVKISTEYAGFYTKSLNKAFEIYPGDVFSVVVTMPSGKGIAKENDVGWAGDFSTNSPSKASYAYNGSWYDYGAVTQTNFRIKAYTNNLSMTGYRAITYVLSGGINNPENPSYFKEGTGVSAFLAPERYGYDFEGWFFDDKFTKSASGINADVRNDVTVYAKWKKNTAPVQPHQCIMNQMCAESKYLRTPADYNMPATYYLSCTCGRFNTVSGYFFSGSPLKRTFLTDCDIYLSKSVYKYDGREKRPTVTVTLNKKTVPKSAYYCLYYSNVNKGTASVFVIANCGANDPVMGSAILNFSIVDNPNEITLSKKSYVLSASSKNQTFYISAKAAAGDIVYKSDTSSVKVSGTGKVTVKKNFVGKATITLSAADASRGTATARVTVKAELAKPSVKTVSSPSVGKIKITWKKPSVASGVEIQYSTDKKFTKSKRVTYEIKGTKTTSKTFAKLKKGKKYYVRLRTYKTVSGERIYSKYSAIKSVKVKK